MSGFEELLFPHAGYHATGGYWRCSCLHTYEAIVDSADQENIIAARHAQHLAEVLISAGAELPKPDPRQALRDRAARRGIPVPSAGKDGGVQTLPDGSLLVPRRPVV